VSSGHDCVPTGPSVRVVTRPFSSLDRRRSADRPSLTIIGVPHRSHYDVLGIDRQASSDEIRRAYRDLARRLHPDRLHSDSAVADPGGARNGRDMAAVNEAYRVLSDPGRRVVYDRSLDRSLDQDGAGRSSTGSAAGPSVWPDPDAAPPPAPRHTPLSPAGPARVPWRMMTIVAIMGSLLVLVSSTFNDPPAVEQPDGILRIGSCIGFEPNGDAREVACTGTDDDVVVELTVPLDGTCPVRSRPHRDRLGLLVVCVPMDG
jgi:molecular chaperone DnaJ